MTLSRRCGQVTDGSNAPAESKRPAARREAKQADEALKLARDRLHEVRALAAPTQQRIDVARAAINGGESSISALRTLHHWSGNETRRDRLVKLDGALSTWRKWAAGGPVVDAEMSFAVRIMKAESNPDYQQPLTHLADAVADWTERVHSALLPYLEVEAPAVRREMGIELYR